MTEKRSQTRWLILTAAMLVACALPLSAQANTIRENDCQLGQELKLPIYSWSNAKVPHKGTIVALHGATLYGSRFDTLAHHLADQGYLIYAMDMRGFGRWRMDNEKYEGDSLIHYTQSRDDIVKVLGTLRNKDPQEKLYVLGESLGANLALWMASEKPGYVDAVILASPCIKRYTHPGPKALITFAKALKNHKKELNLEGHIRPHLSDDPRVTESYFNDPLIYRNLSAENLVKSVKTNDLAIESVSKIPDTLPILIIAGEKDRIYKTSVVPDFCKKLGSKNQTLFIAKDRGHLLLEHPYIAPEVLAKIDDWLVQQNTPGETVVGAAQSTEPIPTSKQ